MRRVSIESLKVSASKKALRELSRPASLSVGSEWLSSRALSLGGAEIASACAFPDNARKAAIAPRRHPQITGSPPPFSPRKPHRRPS